MADLDERVLISRELGGQLTNKGVRHGFDLVRSYRSLHYQGMEGIDTVERLFDQGMEADPPSDMPQTCARYYEILDDDTPGLMSRLNTREQREMVYLTFMKQSFIGDLDPEDPTARASVRCAMRSASMIRSAGTRGSGLHLHFSTTSSRQEQRVAIRDANEKLRPPGAGNLDHTRNMLRMYDEATTEDDAAHMASQYLESMGYDLGTALSRLPLPSRPYIALSAWVKASADRAGATVTGLSELIERTASTDASQATV